MRSDKTQLDLYRDGDAAKAAQFRAAAETARRDPHYTPDEGERRARYYESQAQQYERTT